MDKTICRYAILDKCLSDFHRKYFIDDLIRACSRALRGGWRKTVLPQTDFTRHGTSEKDV